MDCKRTNRDRLKPAFPAANVSGHTLVELMVGVSLGMLLLVGVTSLYLFSVKSFASMSNYFELNGKNRYASDIVSRDIRSASAVASVNSTNLVLRSAKGDVTYAFDPNAGTLTRAQAGEARLLLKGVDWLNFSLYERPPNGSGYEQFPTGTPATAKLVAFRWSCSRKVYGTQKDSHGLEAAIVKLRNK